MCTENSALVIAPGLDQDNTTFEKMIFTDKLVNLKTNSSKERSHMNIEIITSEKLSPLLLVGGHIENKNNILKKKKKNENRNNKKLSTQLRSFNFFT